VLAWVIVAPLLLVGAIFMWSKLSSEDEPAAVGQSSAAMVSAAEEMTSAAQATPSGALPSRFSRPAAQAESLGSAGDRLRSERRWAGAEETYRKAAAAYEQVAVDVRSYTEELGLAGEAQASALSAREQARDTTNVDFARADERLEEGNRLLAAEEPAEARRSFDRAKTLFESIPPPPVNPPPVDPTRPFRQEYSVSTSPGFAFIRVDGELINGDANIPALTVLAEGPHTFQLTSSDGKDLGTLQYTVRRGDPNRVLILKFDEGVVEARPQ
jgi:hypothetical protein